jgi:tRNA-dihydrouridine synthase 3
MAADSSTVAARGMAAVKPQYLLPKPTNQTKVASSGPKPTGNNKRTREEVGLSRERPNMLCRKVSQGLPCRFGPERCRNRHDIKAFLASKPPDLGPTCPNFERRGRCAAGLNCRFGSAHIDLSCDPPRSIERKQTAEEAAADAAAERCGAAKGSGQEAAVGLGVLNMMPGKVLAQLKRKKYRFKKFNGGRWGSSREVASEIASAPKAASKLAAAEAANVVADHGAKLENGTALAPALKVGALAVGDKRRIDFRNKIYIAPLTTLGNLPFRRVCVGYGADITCGEMAVTQYLLQGRPAEWAMLRRHPCERIFGVQLAASKPEMMGRAAQAIAENLDVDFIDLNAGCPIDSVTRRGAGSALMTRQRKMVSVVEAAQASGLPVTVKMRSGWETGKPRAHVIIPMLQRLRVPPIAVAVHGRSREDRYSRRADLGYVQSCVDAQSEESQRASEAELPGESSRAVSAARPASAAPADAAIEALSPSVRDRALKPVPVLFNGDIYSHCEWDTALRDGRLTSCMIGRGALVKPWISTEIKERRHWDISATERLDHIREFVHNGLEYWGSDQIGVDRTRRFLLEWLSFLCRYVPVGVLERVPMRMNERAPLFVGRSDLETLMASASVRDWVKISEMFLGPAPADFNFKPKHRSSGTL